MEVNHTQIMAEELRYQQTSRYTQTRSDRKPHPQVFAKGKN